jgi:hypothetical protein
MSDQCIHCINRGYIDKCLSADCNIHESWAFAYHKRLSDAAVERFSRAEEWIYYITDGEAPGEPLIDYVNWQQSIAAYRSIIKEREK